MCPSSISVKQADLKDMGFVSLFKSACFLFLLHANAARTQTSMHVLSYVTRLRSPLLYLFVVLCDLKPLQVSALSGGPLHWGPGANCPCCPPPVGGTASPPHPLTSSFSHFWHPVWRSGSDQLEGTDIFTLDPPSSWEEVSICFVHHNYVC